MIGAACRDFLAALAKGLFYKERSYANLLLAAREDGRHGDEVGEFERWHGTGKVSQKAIDAVELLQVMAKGDYPGDVPDFRFEQSSVWTAALLSLDETP